MITTAKVNFLACAMLALPLLLAGGERVSSASCLFLEPIGSATTGHGHPIPQDPLVVVVLDPLSDKLACDCVEGYAQRKYEYLGSFLENRLNRSVQVYWGESIQSALEDENRSRQTPLVADLVIGKHSVIVAESNSQSLQLDPVAQLTDKQGSTNQYGLVVVRGNDPALIVEDLEGYRVIFGPANCDEKSAAPRQLLIDAEVTLPNRLETADACSLAAKRMLESPQEQKVAAIISSYAAPLLEGCGTINKGDLRVVGQSEPVPFITAFLRKEIDSSTRDSILDSLWQVGKDPELRQMLETRDGFKPVNVVGDALEKISDDSMAIIQEADRQSTDIKKK